MECNYYVTFEFDTAKPITEKGKVKGSSLRTVVARAAADAVKKNPNMQWSSVVVLVERKQRS